MVSVTTHRLVLPDRSHDQDRQDDQWERKDGVDEAADAVVHEAAEVARDEPESGSEHGADERRRRCDHEDAPRPRDHAREDVAAVRVGPESVAPFGRKARRELVVEDRVVRSNAGEKGTEDPEGEHEGADEHGG